MPRQFSIIPRSSFWGKGKMQLLSLQCSGYIRHCRIGAVSHQISLSSILLGYFVKASSFSGFNFCYNYGKFFLSKLSQFNVKLIANNFRDRFIRNIRGFFKQILSSSVFILLDWQLLVQLLRCSSFYPFHLLSASLFEIVYLLLSF